MEQPRRTEQLEEPTPRLALIAGPPLVPTMRPGEPIVLRQEPTVRQVERTLRGEPTRLRVVELTRRLEEPVLRPAAILLRVAGTYR